MEGREGCGCHRCVSSFPHPTNGGDGLCVGYEPCHMVIDASPVDLQVPLNPDQVVATTTHDHGTISPARGKVHRKASDRIVPATGSCRPALLYCSARLRASGDGQGGVKRAGAKLTECGEGKRSSSAVIRTPCSWKKMFLFFPTTKLGESWTCGQCARTLPCIHCPCLLSPCTARRSGEVRGREGENFN